MNQELGRENFEELLGWLDPDRERASATYEKIRQRLIRIFVVRSCADAEELADEVINRVGSGIKHIKSSYVGDPSLYFYAVAQKVHYEYLPRNVSRLSTDTDPDAMLESGTLSLSSSGTELSSDAELSFRCLDKCLESLTSENRELISRYYQEERHATIENRKLLASELGMPVNALRVRAHRIRMSLHQCVQHCIEKQRA
jgi:DNA-directed RNA polymerase specialized sigma24 family protein